MTDEREHLDPELEGRLRDSFGRAEAPPAPEAVVATARQLAARTAEPARGGWATRLPFAFAAVAVLVTVGMVSAVLSQGRHSTTQGEEPPTPSAREVATPTPTLSLSPAPSSSTIPSPSSTAADRP